MAISRQRKEELVSLYSDWLNRSQATIVAEYKGLPMKQIDDLRSKLRATGGEFHIIKNTLGKVAFDAAGLPQSEKLLTGSSAIIFAFQDAPETVKVITEFARTSEFVRIKGGYLEKQPISAAEAQSLAELPPLPVMRAQLLGTLNAPASQLVRTLVEPARQVAAVLKAFAEKDAAPAAA